MGAEERKDIKSMMESVKYLSVHDPQGLMIIKSNIDVLKARIDMDKVGNPAEEMQYVS